MPLRARLAALLLPLFLLSACLPDVTQPTGTPIDCETLASSVGTATNLTTTASGLRYRDEVVGQGTEVGAGNVVGVYYAGCLTTGTKFDQRLDTDPPFAFLLGATPRQVISGFDEGIRGMKLGGRRQLVIPPALGYGDRALEGIPANSTLVFTIVLVGIR